MGRNEKNTVFVRGRNETTERGLNGTPICVFNIVAPAVVTTKPSNGTLFLPHLSRAEFADRRFQSIDERQTGVNDILIQLVPIDLLHNFILMFRFFLCDGFLLFGENSTRLNKGIGYIFTFAFIPGLAEPVFAGCLAESTVDRLFRDANFPAYSVIL